jgi:hypothetical protein
MKDDYELFPHKMIEELKFDIEALKKKLLEPDKAAEELMAEMADLKEEIKELHNIFQETLNDIKEEDSAKLLKTMESKIETVNTQNETIARGMIAISDKLEDFMSRSKPKVAQHAAVPPMGARPMGAPRAQAPAPQMPPGYTGPTMPPPGAGPGAPAPGVPAPPGMPTPPPAPKPKRAGIFK